MDSTVTWGYIVFAVSLAITFCLILMAVMDRIIKPFVWLSIFAALAALAYGNVLDAYSFFKFSLTTNSNCYSARIF